MFYKIKTFYKKSHSITRLLRFTFVGMLATITHLSIAIIAIKYFLFNQSLSNGLAFLIATLFSYVLNTKWSFSSKIEKKNFFKFCIVSIIGLLLSVTISLVNQLLGWHYLVGILITVLILPINNFLLHNFWTYKTHHKNSVSL